MAVKQKSNTTSIVREKKLIKRSGVHAKTKHSNHKGSKNYHKMNRGQG